MSRSSALGQHQGVGWVLSAFDQFELPYDLIYKEGDPRGQPQERLRRHRHPARRVGQRQAAGVRHRVARYADRLRKSEQFKNLGSYRRARSDTYGPGSWASKGWRSSTSSPKTGGVLVTLGAASFLPAEFGLTPRVDASRTSAAFYSPGAIIDAESPAARKAASSSATTRRRFRALHGGGPLLTVQTGANPFDGPPATPPPTPRALMRYPGGDEDVLSGLMRGANEIRRSAGESSNSRRARDKHHHVRRQPDVYGGRTSASSTCCSTRC